MTDLQPILALLGAKTYEATVLANHLQEAQQTIVRLQTELAYVHAALLDQDAQHEDDSFPPLSDHEHGGDIIRETP